MLLLRLAKFHTDFASLLVDSFGKQGTRIAVASRAHGLRWQAVCSKNVIVLHSKTEWLNIIEVLRIDHVLPLLAIVR